MSKAKDILEQMGQEIRSVSFIIGMFFDHTKIKKNKLSDLIKILSKEFPNIVIKNTSIAQTSSEVSVDFNTNKQDPNDFMKNIKNIIKSKISPTNFTVYQQN